ncbi:hypothetical protein G6F29_004962 [Rhizopus arrhizus]|uniref:Actin interacting protein 3 C-terminal domain-containing protein n=1 Tax=Rhizopus oryzae TaxID=64495 RepID=A0A9P7BWL6_RHIOR|nr:hypothetical protein G6F17_003591 [Rhizopus arrhizus]KAG0875928.1 hypothetical protein G6F16_002696 [Rhizopus arrhizus]KAG0887453.1 hypothetical protein G6F15_002450 [Rhizopus arrhizus]KAG0946440.1 hypothetical protein G6F30_003761 [Rhizopus arrhizus]KAG0984189.1 hypothetical protein G6F29_004962 [Rhizopus arrhizus]
MQCYLTLLLWTYLYYLVKADQISIIQPRSSSVYHVNDEMTIRYNIRSMGMTRIWSTLVTLTQADNNQTIQEFPSLAYSNSNDKKDINGTWANEIEQDLSRLLDSIEKLLEALTAWSLGMSSKIQICENYDALELHLSNLSRALQSETKSTEKDTLDDNLRIYINEILPTTHSSGTMYSTKDAILKLLRAIKLKLVILHKRCDSIPAHSALSKIKLNNRFIRRAIERITLQEKLTENTLMCSDKAALTSFQQAIFEQNMQKSVQDCIKYVSSLQRDNREEETQSLRHELNTLRQMYNNYQQESKYTIEQLQEKIKKQSRLEMGEGKEITQKASLLITNRLEALQEDVEQFKQDIAQRRYRPSKIRLKHCIDESGLLEKEIQELEERLKTYKPAWKKTWEAELQHIVLEQQFLKDQEALLTDLKEEHQAVVDVLKQASQISEIHERKKQQKHDGLDCRLTREEKLDGMASVMKQVTAIHVDHESRLKALDEAETMRFKTLAQNMDVFERELLNFVCLKKLKNIGGPEAIDRQRERKNKAVLKVMFAEQ